MEALPEGRGLQMLPIGDSIAVEPGKSVTVGLQPLPFHAILAPAPASDWVQKNVKVEGAKVELAPADTGTLSFTIPASTKEGTVTIALSSVVPPDGQGNTVTFTLNRKAEPRGTLEVQDGGTWRAVRPGESLRQRPLDLRVVFSSDMTAGSLQAELARRAGTFKWENPKTLLWHLDDPPAVVELDLRQGRGTNGLLVMGDLASAYTGEVPQLVAFDLIKGTTVNPTSTAPATAQATALITLPADVRTALISPDGRKLLVSAFLRSTSRAQNPPIATWVIDTQNGSRRVMPGNDASYFAYLGWADDQSVVALTYEGEVRVAVVDLGGRVLRSWKVPGDGGHLVSVSPDGRRLAVMIGDFDREDQAERLTPYELYVIDLASGQTALEAKDFVWIYSTHSEGRGRNGPAWSPDGRELAAVGDRKQGGGAYVRVADLQKRGLDGTNQAAVTEGASIPDLGHSYQYPFSWSADGRYWVIGDRIVSSRAPFETKGQLSGLGKPLWSLSPLVVRGETDDYGPIRAYQVGAGSAPFLSADLPVGWDRSGTFYGIRWPDYRFRVVWQSGL